MFTRLRRFADTLRQDATAMDSDPAVLARHYQGFVRQELHLLCGSRFPLSGYEFAEALAIFSEVSGAFAFTVLQQMVANMSLTISESEPWPVVGVAFGHLRNPMGGAPIWDGQTVTGFVPWFTGGGLFPEVVLGMRTDVGEEVFAVVATENRPEFRWTEPMPLIACRSTRTVGVQVEQMPLTDTRVVRRQPSGTMAEGDARSVLYQTPLMIGCLRASLALILKSPRVGEAQKQRCKATVNRHINGVLSAFSGCDALTGRKLRAQLGDLTVRLARLAIMASGGSALLTGHSAERLYREALIYSLMAQTDTIVGDAIDEVFP